MFKGTRAQRERGANLVELAIVMLVLVLLIGGITDLGRAMYSYVAITNAAREGARYGVRLPCYSSNTTQRTELRNKIRQAVIDEATQGGIVLTAANVTIAPDPVSTGCAAAGQTLAVTATYQFSPMLTQITGVGPLTLSSTTRMVAFGND